MMMMQSKRYSQIAFPPYAFLPGKNAHPNRDGGYRFQTEDPIGKLISSLAPGNNEMLKFSIDLFNHEFFWESHVYLEALWNAHGRQGSSAHFLKGMIKLAAAGVKIKMKDWGPARVHLENAEKYFREVIQEEDSGFLGFDFDYLIEQIQIVKSEISISRENLFQVHPQW